MSPPPCLETSPRPVGQPVPVGGAVAPEPAATEVQAAQGQPGELPSTLTLLQANLLVAMLGGFWARKADGHPGPDVMGRGLLILDAIRTWEETKKERLRKKPPAKEGRRKPGRPRPTRLRPHAK